MALCAEIDHDNNNNMQWDVIIIIVCHNRMIANENDCQTIMARVIHVSLDPEPFISACLPAGFLL
jgi:hypothetical protein